MGVELHFVPSARQAIAVLEYEPRRSREVTIVAAHGYSSSKHNLDFLGAFLAAQGFRVYSLDFPGHKLGASGGRLDAFADCTSAMTAVVAFARSRSPGPLYVMGHSLGAMTALRVAVSDASLAGAISIATGSGRLGALTAMGRVANVDFRSSYVAGLTLREIVEQAERDDELAGLAGRPALFVAAEQDAMVTRKSALDLFDRAPEPKTMRWIASDHTDAAQNAKADVLAWLNELHPRG